MIGMNEIVTEKRDMAWPLVRAVIVFVLSVVLLRSLFYYYVNPAIFFSRDPHPSSFSKESFLVGVLEIGLIAAIAIIIQFVLMYRLLVRKEKDLVRENLETELKFLRNQINPHFLFNTLNNIYALARRKSEDTPDVVVRLSKILRFMLYESKARLVKICDEKKMLEDYIELERIRHNSRLTIGFLQEIDDENQELAPLLLITFVENAFKHGIRECRLESFILMELKLQKKMLSFCIENSKEVAAHKRLTENIGLSNVRRQLELLYSDHSITVENKDRSFKVTLTINLNSYASI
jgi:two-component system, LytTR family, sensor kinase